VTALAPALVLALDGATLDVVRPLVREGRLPNLARWMREGTSAPLPSVVPPVTFPAWSSFMTGLVPGEHGVFDFTQKLEGAYRIRFVNASDRRGRSLFARVCDAGGSVLVLGMPAAFPPERLEGLLVCGFDAPVSTGTDASSASDPPLYERIAARAGPWMRPDLDESARDASLDERAVPTLLGRIERKTAFALEALRVLRERAGGVRPELMMVVFSESDTVGHHYWRDHDPRSPRRDPAASATRRGAVRAVYEALDRACGRIRAAYGEDTPCFVLSDHGMGGASRRVVHLNRHLEEQGLLVRRHGAFAQRGRAARSARDAALRVLPAGVAQRVFRRARGAAARLESAVRFGGLDWRRTRAWSEEANTQPGVWINLRGREARGCVAPEDYEAVRDEVIAALEAWRLPGAAAATQDGGGGRVVASARRREEVHRGPFVSRAPDVAIELALEDGYGHSLVPTPWVEAPPAVRTLAPEEQGGGRGRGMNGTHRAEGIWIAAPAVVPGRDARAAIPGRDRPAAATASSAAHSPCTADEAPASLAHAAPAIARVMGLAWRDHGTADGDGDAPEARRDYSADEDELVARRLRALGYLECGSIGARRATRGPRRICRSSSPSSTRRATWATWSARRCASARASGATSRSCSSTTARATAAAS